MKRLDQLEVDFYKCSDIEQAISLTMESQLDDVMVSIHDTQGKYLELSSTVTALLGYGQHEMIGTSAYDHFHPDDFQAILLSHAKVTIRPEVDRVEYRLRKANREYIDVYTLSKPIKGESGEDRLLALTVKRR
jgi:PAS domain S-box-containing protein